VAKFYLWGVIASPYLLKMQSLLDAAGHEWERWPEQGKRIPATIMLARLERAKRRGEVKRFPRMSATMDEYPSVPFYSLDQRNFYYDSSALALHLDTLPERDKAPLIPQDPALAFICRLIDEAFDEFGLYMAHHMRWVGSARTTPMGVMTAQEMRSVLPPGFGPVLARGLPQRQVRRLPYLLSVAPDGYSAAVARLLTPSARRGFPATHRLIDDAWQDYLAAMEYVLSAQPYLLGECFTLADASAYGQLSMNLVDGDAADRLESVAPRAHRWLCAIRDGEHKETSSNVSLNRSLKPLLDIIADTFVPLMAQNEEAYEQAVAAGETLFNEAAFDKSRALYAGQLRGHSFCSVVKTFQVQVWRDLKSQWQALPDSAREHLAAEFLGESASVLDGPGSPV
jgi:glutathione S-transferase